MGIRHHWQAEAPHTVRFLTTSPASCRTQEEPDTPQPRDQGTEGTVSSTEEGDGQTRPGVGRKHRLLDRENGLLLRGLIYAILGFLGGVTATRAYQGGD